MAVLFENAKATPQILTLAKAQEMAQAEVAKQKRHIFSYVTGHASYSYGVSDMWGNSTSAYNMRIVQFQGSEQKYWNVGVNLAVPLEDILDLRASIKRKKLEVDLAQLKKDQAYDQLKLDIAKLYVSITNNLVALKTRLGVSYKGWTYFEPGVFFEVRTQLNAPWGSTSGSLQTKSDGTTYYAYTHAGYTHTYNDRYRGIIRTDIKLGKHHVLRPYVLLDYISEYEIDTNSEGTRLFSAAYNNYFKVTPGIGYTFKF